MELKRIYHQGDLERYIQEKKLALENAKAQALTLNVSEELTNEIAKRIVDEKAAIQPPRIERLLLAHTGTNPAQHFSLDLAITLLTCGLMEIEGHQLTLHVEHNGAAVALQYRIQREPGRYCLHCDAKLEGDEGGQMARLHVAQKHANTPSPDPVVPAGYIWLKHYECVLADDQHAKFRHQPGRVYRYPVEVRNG
jgi:hypothetical protein